MSTNNSSIIPFSSTAAAAAVILALASLDSTPATASDIQPKLEQQFHDASIITTHPPIVPESLSTILTTSIDTIAEVDQYDESSRPTSLSEQLIGEIRCLALLKSNWDGEGAEAPSAQSVREAELFVRLLGDITLPEPMLLASGHTALYWNEDNLYADLEFLGDGRIAYFIKRHGDKHKGVLTFDSQEMPTVFPTLIRA